jgi:hypothetical protein
MHSSMFKALLRYLFQHRKLVLFTLGAMLLTKVKKFREPVLKFIRKNSEYVTLPMALVLWYFSPELLRLIDPTAATFDSGIFQIILFGIIKFLVIHSVAWFLLKLRFPYLFQYLDSSSGFQSELRGIPFITNEQKFKLSCQRLQYSFLFFSLYLLALLVCVATV